MSILGDTMIKFGEVQAFVEAVALMREKQKES